MVANASTNMRNAVKDQVLQEEVDQVPEVHSIPHGVSEVHQALQAELTNHKFHAGICRRGDTCPFKHEGSSSSAAATCRITSSQVQERQELS